MIYCILVFCIAFAWLLLETKFLTIRLPYGKNPDTGIKLLNAGKIETILMLPEAKKESYFMPCEIENPDVVSKNIVSVGCKIL